MKLLFTSDLHGNKQYYEKLFNRARKKDIQAIIIGGDLSPRGGTTLQEWVAIQRRFLEDCFIKECKKLYEETGIKTYFIMGNDDFKTNASLFKPPTESLEFIHKQSIPLTKDINLVGYSIVNTTPFRLKDWEKPDFAHSEPPRQIASEILRTAHEEKGTIEEDLNSMKSLSNPRKTIYVTHAPPFNTALDITQYGIHVGSMAIREFILKEQPLLTLHGHIHESSDMSGTWFDLLENTKCINIGSAYPEEILRVCIINPEDLKDITYEEV